MSGPILAGFIVTTIFTIFGFVLNVTGTTLLRKLDKGITNQRLILMNLSICQGAISLLVTILQITIMSVDEFHPRFLQTLRCTIYGLYIQYYLIMIIMAVDRTIGTKFPLRYPIIFSRRKAKFLLAMAWILAVVYGTVSACFYNEFRNNYFSFVLPIFDSVVFLCIAVSYSYIMFLLCTRKIQTASEQIAVKTRKAEGKQLLKVAGIISLTFVLFNLIPDAIIAITYKSASSKLWTCVQITWSLGLLSDPITYLFFQKKLRTALLNAFKYRRSSINSIPSVAVISTRL